MDFHEFEDGPEDLELKLKADQLNDMKNLMYLKGKIITGAKKILTNRYDYQKLIKEKKQSVLLAEKQMKEMK